VAREAIRWRWDISWESHILETSGPNKRENMIAREKSREGSTYYLVLSFALRTDDVLTGKPEVDLPRALVLLDYFRMADKPTGAHVDERGCCHPVEFVNVPRIGLSD
jgi:hypothetical protein